MKDSFELAQELLARRDRYWQEQRRRRKKIWGTACGVGCAGLLATAGVGVWQVGRLDTASTDILSSTPYSSAVAEESSTPSSVTENKPDHIVVVPIAQIPDNMRAMYCLLWDDYVPMDKEELNDYYGSNVFPEVPQDLVECGELNPTDYQGGSPYGIFRREQGQGEVYWDGNTISYTNEDGTRTVNVTVDQGQIPTDFCNLFDEIETKSRIQNTEVGIAKTFDGMYYAELLYHNVGFRIVTQGLTEQELVEIITSLLQ